MSHHSPSPDYVSGPEHLPSPDYVPGPEEPEQALLSPNYVPEPEYPKYLVPYEAEAPIEDQPLSDDVSPTALSLGYVADLDPKEDPYKDPKEDLVNCPVDGRDNNDDESSDDDDDDDEHKAFEDDDKEKKEHPALANSSVVHVNDPVPSVEDTKTFKSDESAPTPVPSPRRHTARIFIPSPPLPLPLPPTTSPTYAKAPLRNRADEIRLRVASPSTHHPLEIPSPTMLLPSTSHRDDTPKADMPLWKRAHFTAPASGFEVEESSAVAVARQSVLDVANVDATPSCLLSREVSYGIKNVWYDMVGDMEEKAPTTALRRIQTLEAREPARIDDLEDAGIEGVVELTRWFEKMKSVFSINNCTTSNQVKFATCTLQDDALTWWNSYVKTTTSEEAYAMTWATLKKKMTGKYCPRGEIKKIETEMWNLKLQSRLPQRVLSHQIQRWNYTELEQEQSKLGFADALAEHEANISRNNDDNHDSGSDRRRRMPVTRECTYTDFLKCQLLIIKSTKGVVGLTQWGEIEKLEIELWNLKVKGTNVDAIEFTTELMDQKIRTLAEHQAENKRKFEDISRNNQNQQQPIKRHNVERAYTTGHGEKCNTPK
nr:reverse transcriptase domain-containing protein [Tanacetum cinerariifolium]